MCRMQVSKIAESGTDYRKFYINNGQKIMRLRAETKCASHPRGFPPLTCHFPPHQCSLQLLMQSFGRSAHSMCPCREDRWVWVDALNKAKVR